VTHTRTPTCRIDCWVCHKRTCRCHTHTCPQAAPETSELNTASPQKTKHYNIQPKRSANLYSKKKTIHHTLQHVATIHHTLQCVAIVHHTLQHLRPQQKTSISFKYSPQVPNTKPQNETLHPKTKMKLKSTLYNICARHRPYRKTPSIDLTKGTQK